MKHAVLCFNMGSSSLKFAFYLMGRKEESLLAEGEAERIGLQDGHLWVRGAKKEVLEDSHADFTEHGTAISTLFSSFERLSLPKPSAVGHRIVHGGPDYASPARIDPPLLDGLKKLVPFAPLHLPGEILVIEAVTAHLPGLPQVACFDTAFHRTMPEIAQRFPLSRNLWQEGVRRYGFHGLSYEYILSALGTGAQGRLVMAHLGNGASVAAVKNGRPLDTSMGFSPAGGFMMGTRSGDLDPGVLLYLMNEMGYDARSIEDLVNHHAGLAGVSEISPDMKTLLNNREKEPHAYQAIEMFCYQLSKQIGAFAAVLGGIDTLVFTGGIGENAAFVRLNVCRRLEFLGVLIDEGLNRDNAAIITVPESPCTVKVLPTKEDLVIARHTYKLLFRKQTSALK